MPKYNLRPRENGFVVKKPEIVLESLAETETDTDTVSDLEKCASDADADVVDSSDENDIDFGDHQANYETLFDGWHCELSKKEIKKYEPIIDRLKSKFTDFGTVLRANMLEKDKENAIEQAVVLKKMLEDEDIGTAFFSLQNKLVRNIKTHENYTVDQLTEYKKREEALIQQIPQNELRFQILDLPVPNNIKTEIIKRYHHLAELTPKEDEYAKQKEWIDCAMALPWNKFTALPVNSDSTCNEKAEFIQNLLEKWDKKQGYVRAAKEEIMLNLMDQISKKNSKSLRPKILTLRGSPGTGKTLFLSSLAEILGIGIAWIDFSGATDPVMIRGHNYTYVGAQPGRIIKGAIQIGSMNGIIVLEELDKIVQNSGSQNKVENALVSLLDRTRSDWIDDYLEFPFDISNYIFVATINDEKLLTDPLKNRLHIIEFPAYTSEQKLQIVKQFEIPNAMNVRGMIPDNVIISDSIIRYIINKLEKEDGVRTLKRAIESIVQRVNFYLQIGGAANVKVQFEINDFKVPFVVNEHHVDKFLEHLKPTGNDWKKIYM